MVSYLKAQSTKHHASHNNAKKTMNKIFWGIKVGGISQSHDGIYNIVSGNKSMHHVQSMSIRNPTLIQFRHVFYVCMGCVDKNSRLECKLVNHVSGWTLSRLVLRDQIQVRATMLQQNEDGKIEVQIRRECHAYMHGLIHDGWLRAYQSCF